MDRLKSSDFDLLWNEREAMLADRGAEEEEGQEILRALDRMDPNYRAVYITNKINQIFLNLHLLNPGVASLQLKSFAIYIKTEALSCAMVRVSNMANLIYNLTIDNALSSIKKFEHKLKRVERDKYYSIEAMRSCMSVKLAQCLRENKEENKEESELFSRCLEFLVDRIEDERMVQRIFPHLKDQLGPFSRALISKKYHCS